MKVVNIPILDISETAPQERRSLRSSDTEQLPDSMKQQYHKLLLIILSSKALLEKHSHCIASTSRSRKALVQLNVEQDRWCLARLFRRAIV